MLQFDKTGIWKVKVIEIPSAHYQFVISVLLHFATLGILFVIYRIPVKGVEECINFCSVFRLYLLKQFVISIRKTQLSW